jgi:hypothetical protein
MARLSPLAIALINAVSEALWLAVVEYGLDDATWSSTYLDSATGVR